MNRNFLIIISVVLGGYFLFNTLMVKPASKEQVSPLKPEEVVAAGIPVEDVKVQPVSMDIPKKVKKINNVLLQNDEPQKIKEADPEPTFEPRTENLMMVM